MSADDELMSYEKLKRWILSHDFQPLRSELPMQEQITLALQDMFFEKIRVVQVPHHPVYKVTARLGRLAPQTLRPVKLALRSICRELGFKVKLRDNGEGFLYLGRSYRLLLVANQDESLVLKNGRFCLRRDLVERGGISAARAAFREYYITHGKERITRRVHYFAPKVGVVTGKINVRELGHRWASCSPNGNLAFHWKCMMAPPNIVDYITVHELCHLHHLDHTEAFWNEVDKVMSNYNERKEWLKTRGASLDI